MSKIFQLKGNIRADALYDVLVGEHRTLGNSGDFHFNNIANLDNANEHSLVFIRKSVTEVEVCILNVSAKVMLLDLAIYDRISQFLSDKQVNKLFIFTRSPRTNFSKILEKFVVDGKDPCSQETVIHSTAIVADTVSIGHGVTIGPYSIIKGKVSIGDGTTIGPRVIIEDGVRIGKNVIVDAGCVFGAKGYAEIIDEVDSNRTYFPQLGGIRIENNVQVGVGTLIQRGTMQDTVIGEGSVIDNNVVIAHNVELGRNVIIIGSSHIGGSVRIGEGTFIGQSVTVGNVGSIGAHAFIGMGSVVTRPIKEKERVFGNPAKPILAPNPQ